MCSFSQQENEQLQAEGNWAAAFIIKQITIF